MHSRRETFQFVALALGFLIQTLASANPRGSEAPDAVPVPALTSISGNYDGTRSFLELPAVLPPTMLPVLLAQAGVPGIGTFFDASQISPLGDPAWVAAMRGPDPSKPAINIELGAQSQIREKDRLPATGVLGGDATVRNGQALRNGRVFLIGAERSPLNKGGSILLAPGRVGELGDLGVPFVRVHVAAPAGSALDVDVLVGKRPAIGMFNALFAPVPARRGASDATAVASVSVPAPAARSVASGADVKAAPVEDRSGALMSIIPASVEDRSFVAFVAPVEDRSALFAAIPPASVEERSFVAFAAPVEDKAFAQRPLVPAPIEERALVMIARDIGKPVPGMNNDASLAAVKELSVAPAAGLMKAALTAPVVIVTADSTPARRAEVSGPAPAPVKLAAIQRRLPNIMIDRRGSYFFM